MQNNEAPGFQARSKRDRIRRLRTRLEQIIQTREQDVQLVAVLKGVLDLLEDEL